MNKDEIVNNLVFKIKEIEKEESRNYLGQMSATDRKKYQKDVVGRILGELENILKKENEN